MTKILKPSEVYAEAARRVERDLVQDPGNGSCCAIAEVMHPELGRAAAYRKEQTGPVIGNYENLFAPRKNADGYWGEAWDDPKNCRILALCFMAAIAESEGR